MRANISNRWGRIHSSFETARRLLHFAAEALKDKRNHWCSIDREPVCYHTCRCYLLGVKPPQSGVALYRLR